MTTRDRDWDYFPPSRPRQVADGIRPQGRQLGKSWWAKRWISALESLGLGSRLQRGRSYARQGQVVSIEIGQGVIEAKVQGSRRQPYAVTIELKPLPDKVWQAVGREIRSQAVYAAPLLGGEMPKDIEEAFRKADVALFPARRSDLSTKCSCPDWENPCKHIAAVFYIVGDELDRDPFLMFRLRGLDQGGLRRLVAGAGDEPGPQAGQPAEPLPASPASFWDSDAPRGELPPAAPPSAPAPLLARLGNPPFWRGSRDLLDWLAPVYAEASARALAFLEDGVDELPVQVQPLHVVPPPGHKSRDRAALEREIAAGASLDDLALRYDGRLLRPYRTAAGSAGGGQHD